MDSEKTLETQDTESHFSASETLENQGLQEPEIEIGDKCHSLAFEQSNEVTWKLTDGRAPTPGMAIVAAIALRGRWRG